MGGGGGGREREGGREKVIEGVINQLRERYIIRDFKDREGEGE